MATTFEADPPEILAADDSTVNPLGSSMASTEERLRDVEKQLEARFAGMPTLDVAEQNTSTGVTAVLARIATAPTNWHQATIYFMTSKSEHDIHMRKLSPLLFVTGLFMVIMQTASVYGLLQGMLHPSCVTNAQCTNTGFFCYTRPGDAVGKCQMCGEYPPLVPYRSETITVKNSDKLKPGQDVEFAEYNSIWDQHYPQGSFGKRSRTPDAFAGWNYTMIQDTCAVPIRSFNWDFTSSTTGVGTPELLSIDRRDVPTWLPTARINPRTPLFATHFSESSVARWCTACVENTAIDTGDGITLTDRNTSQTVSIMNKRLLAMTSMDAMSMFDWVALVMCSYLVGLQVVGEIKDTALCEMAIQRHIKELSPGWQLALHLLNLMRGQIFLHPLMGAIPAVVLTQGGSALNICFNTLAVLFITEVDNLSYTFGLGERAKERVDTYGHVVLDDYEARQLSVTKALCVVCTVVFTIWLVTNGASVAAMLAGAGATLGFKLSELATRHARMTWKQIGVFVLTAVTTQVLSVALMFNFITGWYEKH